MKRFLCLIFILVSCIDIFACTSVIFSSAATADGRPLMWKHRDSGFSDNRLQYFEGEKYSFAALVNSVPGEVEEAWIGMNTEGFSLMNTASYNLKDDDVPYSEMDKEGFLMFRALGVCRTVDDFEKFLEESARPLGVEANFGVIDAFGGAAYFEVGNFEWVKYDVADTPEGYMVVTNFSRSGRPEDRRGYERYLTAEAIFSEMCAGGIPYDISPEMIFNALSRSFRHEFMGLDYTRNYEKMIEAGYCNGIIPDQDFIPRNSTSASVAVHGVAPGDNPLKTVMWTVLGYPLCSIAVPVVNSMEDHIPYFMKKSPESFTSAICDDASYIKDKYVFRFKTSSGPSYLDISPIFSGESPLIECCRKAEAVINEKFGKIYGEWCCGDIDFETFLYEYDLISNSFYEAYYEFFYSFLL